MTTFLPIAYDEIYAGIVSLDEKTGLPNDYDSFFAAYRPLIMATARRVGIPEQDVADAASEVAIKFWLKDGLSLYDPDRRTRFATLLRNWAGMFMLQERDKTIKQNKRFLSIEPADFSYETPIGNTTQDHSFRRADTFYSAERSAEESLLLDERIQQWAGEAERALERANKKDLIPVLKACVNAAEEGTAPSRAEIAEAAGCKITKATSLLQELRRTLTSLGYGMESIYE